MTQELCKRCKTRPALIYKGKTFSYCAECKRELNVGYMRKFYQKQADSIAESIRGIGLAEASMLEALPQENEDLLLAVAKYISAVDGLIGKVQK